MLRLTVSVVQHLTDAYVHAAVHQEDPYDGSSSELGSVQHIYPIAHIIENYDELTSLLMVLHRWAGLSTSQHVERTLDMHTTHDFD
jgi:hypothetical protein